MNGRVYDPEIGRFLSADPHVQAPHASQSYNRYAYALNNPLKYTDPSGYFFKKLFRAIKKVLKNPLVRAVLGIVAGLYAYAYFGILTGSKAIAAFAGGFTGGLVASGGDLKQAAIGGVTALAFYGIGSHFEGLARANGGALSGLQKVGKVIVHGVAGGLSSRLSGGRFKDGFLSAGFTQAASLSGKVFVEGDKIGNAVKAAVLGGTASVVGGGKFANGAVTGAFSRLFNDGLHPTDKAGRTRPGPGFVIGPKGYWQMQIGAETELLHGPNSQMTQAAIPGNTPMCEATCVAVGTTDAFVNGSEAANALSTTSDVLVKHPNQGVSAGGHVIRRFVLPAKVYHTAVEFDSIKNYCARLCGMDPYEYQLNFQRSD